MTNTFNSVVAAPPSPPSALFPPLAPYRSGSLAVDAYHTLYWEESGNPQGVPVLFLHGGPGGGTSPQQRRFFDPAYYRIILFDQRGAGRSTPAGRWQDNTTPLLVADIERLRRLLAVERWLVFGGSWGATLALAYGQAWPQYCLGFILRGVFLCTAAEIDWFMHGVGWFFPEAYAEFAAHIPLLERGDLLGAYGRRLFCDDPEIYLPAARAWSRYETACVFLKPRPAEPDSADNDAVSLGIGRLEAHYFLHRGFMREAQLVEDIGRLHGLPAIVVQGRYDVICPPGTAQRLCAAWPEARLVMIDHAGHSAFENDTAAALVAATEQFRSCGRFRE